MIDKHFRFDHLLCPYVRSLSIAFICTEIKYEWNEMKKPAIFVRKINAKLPNGLE